MSVYDALHEIHGLSGLHLKTIEWVPQGARVLEIGCAGGYFGEALMHRRGCVVHGIEVDEGSAERARARGLQVTVGDLDDPELLQSITGSYDAVVATDVLEHLKHPDRVLRQMHQWLAPGGRVVAAVPNVAAWSMRMHFLSGRFEYQDSGQLDRTHIRFFTWETFHELVADAGFEVADTMVGEWQFPVVYDLLVAGPRKLRTALWESPEQPPDSVFGRFTKRATDEIMSVHHRLAGKAGPMRPNVCAAHMGLLLRPAS